MNETEFGSRKVSIRRAFDWSGQTGYEAWTDSSTPIFAPVISLIKRDMIELSSIRSDETILWQIEPPMDEEEMIRINEEVKTFKSE